MASINDKKFKEDWKKLKNDAGVKSSPWFKTADAAVSSKVEAYQKAKEKAKSGVFADIEKWHKALNDLKNAFDKFVTKKNLDDSKKTADTAKKTLIDAIAGYKLEVDTEYTEFNKVWTVMQEAYQKDPKAWKADQAQKKMEAWNI